MEPYAYCFPQGQPSIYDLGTPTERGMEFYPLHDGLLYRVSVYVDSRDPGEWPRRINLWNATLNTLETITFLIETPGIDGYYKVIFPYPYPIYSRYKYIISSPSDNYWPYIPWDDRGLKSNGLVVTDFKTNANLHTMPNTVEEYFTCRDVYFGAYGKGIDETTIENVPVESRTFDNRTIGTEFSIDAGSDRKWLCGIRYFRAVGDDTNLGKGAVYESNSQIEIARVTFPESVEGMFCEAKISPAIELQEGLGYVVCVVKTSSQSARQTNAYPISNNGLTAIRTRTGTPGAGLEYPGYGTQDSFYFIDVTMQTSVTVHNPEGMNMHLGIDDNSSVEQYMKSMRECLAMTQMQLGFRYYAWISINGPGTHPTEIFYRFTNLQNTEMRGTPRYNKRGIMSGIRLERRPDVQADYEYYGTLAFKLNRYGLVVGYKYEDENNV